MKIKKTIFVIIFCGVIATNFIFATESNQVDPLGLSKKLMYETARVLVSKDNMLVLDEIASYDWYFGVDTQNILPYLSTFRTTINDFKSIEERRDLLYYMSEQAKSMSLAQLVPNAISVGVVAFSTGNPLRALIAIGGTALSSYTNYTTARQQAALKLIEEEFELNQQQNFEITELYNDMFETISLLFPSYGFRNEDFVSPNTLKDFVNDVIEYADDPSSLILCLMQSKYQRELTIFPEYWRALATAYYETDQFEAALDCINEYEKIYVKTMYHDNAHGTLMMIKVYCIDAIWPESPEKYEEMGEALDEVLSNGENSWFQTYYCVCMYKRIFEETGNCLWLDLAYKHLFDVVLMLSSQYEKDMEDYISGAFIAKIKDGIDTNIENKKDLIDSQQRLQNDDNAGKQAKDDAKKREKELEKEIEELEQNKEVVDELEYTFLPPDSSLFVSLAKEFFELAIRENKTDDPAFLTLKNKIYSLITDIYSRYYLFNMPYPEMELKMIYDHRVPALNPFSLFDGRDKASLYVPMDYATISDTEFNSENTRIFLNLDSGFDSYEYELTDWTYEIIKNNDSDVRAIAFNFIIDDPVETHMIIPKGTIPDISVRFESTMIQIPDLIAVSVDKPKELLKGFKVNIVKDGDSAIQTEDDSSQEDAFEFVSFFEELLNDFDSAFPIKYDSGIIIDNIGDKEINITFPYSIISEMACKHADDEYPLFSIEGNSLSFYLDINSYQQLRDILPFLTNPNFEVYGPEYNQGMSEEDYFEMVSFMFGDKGHDAVSNAVVTITISVPGTIRECNGCVQIDENTIEYEFSLIDFLLLKEPLSFSVNWY